MCTCVDDKENALCGVDYRGKKITKATLEESALFLDNRTVRQMVTTAKVVLLNTQRTAKINIKYAYCPFCGKKYN